MVGATIRLASQPKCAPCCTVDASLANSQLRRHPDLPMRARALLLFSACIALTVGHVRATTRYASTNCCLGIVDPLRMNAYTISTYQVADRRTPPEHWGSRQRVLRCWQVRSSALPAASTAARCVRLPVSALRSFVIKALQDGSDRPASWFPEAPGFHEMQRAFRALCSAHTSVCFHHYLRLAG
jgi:hypothetical protein